MKNPKWSKPAAARVIKAVLVIMVIAGIGLWQRQANLEPVNEEFVQTDWSGGISVNKAVHPTDKTNWPKYTSKDSTITTSAPGRIILSTELNSLTDTSDTDFGAGTRSLLDISGTGDSASIMLQGGITDPFLSNVGQWTSSVPEIPNIEWWSPFVKAGSYIYCLWRDKAFGRWDIANEKWEFMADTPKCFGIGAALAYPGSGDFIYALRGSGTKGFWRYSISGDSWTTLADVTYPVRDGSALTATTGKVYCVPGWVDNRRKFLEYSISGESWATLTDTSYDAYHKGALVCPDPAGFFIYYFPRRDSTPFYRYNISTGNWENPPDPTTVYTVCYPCTGNYIYGWRGDDDGRYFQRFDLTAQTWGAAADLPRLPARVDNGILYYPGSGTKLKLLSSSNYNHPALTFDTSTDKWDEEVTASYGTYYYLGYGSRFIYDGSDYIYKTQGQANTAYFQRYKISTNTWENLANLPSRIHTGGGAVYHNGYLYAIRGENTTTFMRYDPSANTWSTRADSPAGFYYGSALCSAGSYIYAFRGYNTASFYRYDLSTNTWDDAAVADAPATVYYGGALVYPGSGDFIYASRGQSTPTFWKYSISGDEWTQVADASFCFYLKGTLTYPGTGNYIYAFFGWYSAFGRYNFTTDTWEPLPDTPYEQSYYYGAEAVGDKVYYTYNDRLERDLFTYTISTGEWSAPKYVDSYYPYYGSAVSTGGDDVYMFYGYFTSNIFKYSVSAKRWTGIIKAPFLLGYGTKATYPGSGNLIYVLRGGGTKELWEYNFSTDTWTKKGDAPWPVYHNSQLDGRGDTLFACQGIANYPNTELRGYGFAKYTISTNTWEEKLDLPDFIHSNEYGRGNKLAYVPSAGTSGKVYASTYSDNYMRIYDIATNIWFSSAVMPNGAYFRGGGIIDYPGTGSDLYVSPGSSYNRFYKYSTSGDTWTELSRPSFPRYTNTIDGDMFYPGSGDFLYLCDGYNKYFARYSLSADKWDMEVAFANSYMDELYSCFERGADGDTIYAGGYNAFHRYNISDRTWTGLTSPYTSLGWRWDEWVPALCYPFSGDYLYTTRGRNRSDFARYSISGNIWEALTSPGTYGSGHKLAGTPSKIYCLMGNSTTAFKCYGPDFDAWSNLAAIPDTVNFGSSLLYPAGGNYIYATRGSGSTDFYRYAISLNTWESLADAPVPLGGGSGGSYGGTVLAYPGRGDYIYLLPGTLYSSTTDNRLFFRYSISGDTWEEIGPTPVGFRSISALAYPGIGDYLYGKRGYGYQYDGIFKYLVFKQGTYTSEAKNVGRNKEYDIVTWNDNGNGFIETKVRTADNLSMTGATDWISAPSRNKGDDLSLSYPTVSSADEYLQYQAGLFMYDINELPALNDITIKHEAYVHQQEIISSAYDTTEGQNRFMKLSWDETQLTGTDIRFQLRTAPDSSGSPGVWSSWLGPAGTQTFNDDYSLESEYSYDPLIEVTNDVARLKKIYEDFSYTQRIILDNSEGTISYTDGVFTIEIDSANDAFWGHVKPDGGDIRFADAQGNTLEYNCTGNDASFDYAAKTASIFVKIPSVPAGQKTSIYLKYGKADAVSISDETLSPMYKFSTDGVMDGDVWEYLLVYPYADNDYYLRMRSNTGAWGSSYLRMENTYARQEGTTFIWKVMHTTTSWAAEVMMGWKNDSSRNHYDQMPHAMYFYQGWIDIYEDGTLIKDNAASWSTNTWYDCKIVLKAAGAKYYYKTEASSTWTLIYESDSGTASPLCFFADKYGYYNSTSYDTYTKQWWNGSAYEGSSYRAIYAPTYFTSIANNATSPSLSGWDYREQFDIDNTNGPALTDYQITATLSPTHDDFWSRCKSDGYDIRFIDSDNETILNYYRESFDYDNQAATLRVKVPAIAAGSIERIYLYYGRADAADASSVDNTLVKDFGEKGTNTSAVSLDGIGDSVSVAHSDSLNISTNVTLEANVKYTADTWLPGFAYRKKMTIDNTGGSELTNKLVQFDVTYVTGKMNADYSDLRFVDTDGTKLIYRIKEYDETKATVVVEISLIPANSTKDIYVYYGNGSAASESDETIAGEVPPNGLVGYWKFDDGSGAVATDSSPTGNNGTVNTPDWVDGRINKALHFTSSDSSNVYIPDNTAYDFYYDDFAIGFWVKHDSITSSNTYLELGYYYDGILIRQENSNTLYIWIDGGTKSWSFSPSLNTWYHLLFVRENTNLTLYVDGVQLGTTSSMNHNMRCTSNAYIGRSYHTTGQNLRGIMDEVCIYNRALSTAEIEEVYRSEWGISFTPTFAAEEAQPAIDQTIIGKSGAYELKFTQSGLAGLINGAEVVSTVGYNAGSFMHTALTYDGAEVKLYVDGDEKASEELTGAINTNSNDLVIGDGIKGLMDEVRVWNIAREIGSIDEDKEGYLDGDEAGLVCYLRFNENGGAGASDAAANGNNGTLAGDAGWLAAPFAYTNGKYYLLYHMDEGFGVNADDFSDFNNTLSLEDVSWSISDLTGFSTGSALVFNGTSAYGSAPDSASLDAAGKITIEAWIKPDTLSGTRTIISKGDDSQSRSNYRLTQSGSSISFLFYNGEDKIHTVGESVLTGEAIHHVAATFDESADTVKIYVNGEEKYSGTETSTMLANDDHLYIGREASGAAPFDGFVDDVRIYNRILPANEVLCHYQHRLYIIEEPVIDNIYEPPISGGIGVYAANHPVVQPVLGVFYTDENIMQFQEISNKPWETEIKYQISPNGYRWYWYDGDGWVLVDGGYLQANTADDINTNLSTFQDAFTEGDFYYRAYLHADPSALNTPSLDRIGTTLVTGESYYADPAGATAINDMHTDADNDQWIQYKAIFYSEGEVTPVLSEMNLEYIKSYITVNTPNGDEKLAVGDSYDITWDSQAITKTSGDVKLEYSADGGSTYTTIAENVSDTGTYSWDPIPDAPSQSALIKITAEDFDTVSDTSDAVFRILSLEVTSPNGGEKWERGRQIHAITWVCTGAVPGNILKIEYSTDSGNSWQPLTSSAPNTGSYGWTVPSQASDNCMVRVSSPSNLGIMDVSDEVFSILPLPAITILSPIAGETWYVGEENEISWSANQLQFADEVLLEYSTDGFGADINEIATVSIGTPEGPNPNDNIAGSYNWVDAQTGGVVDAVSSTVKIRITETAAPQGRDTQSKISKASDTFAIAEPVISVTSPTMQDTWVVGDVNDITWTSTGKVSDNLTIEYSIDGSIWDVIGNPPAASEADDGSYSWTTPLEAVGDSVYIRITDNERTQVQGISEPFKVLENAAITVIQPNGSEELTIGTDYAIQWSTIGNDLELGGADYNEINVYYSTDSGSTWTLEAYQRPNTGSYTWTVKDAKSENVLIKITDNSDEDTIYDVSDAVFSIIPPAVTITSPNGGEFWYATGNYNVTWTSTGTIGQNSLKLEYSTDAGITWNEVAAGLANDGEYTWTSVADVSAETQDALVRLTDTSRPVVTDVSDGAFTITPPTITLIFPNGGQELAVGSLQSITWVSVGYDNGAIRDSLTIQYSADGGSTWNNIALGEGNDNLYTWQAANDISDTCLIKIFDVSREATSDTSDTDFKIVKPYIQITTPGGGEQWPIGSEQEVKWVSVGSVADFLKFEYTTDNFVTATEVADEEDDDGSYMWTIPDDLSSSVKLRIWDTTTPDPDVDPDNSIFDICGASEQGTLFAIVNPRINITAPNGGELWTIGDDNDITWDNIGSVGANLKLEYSKDGFASDVNVIAATTAENTGTYSWEVANDVSTTVKIRITDNTRDGISDKSNATFTILPLPEITITAPEEGDVWYYGTEHEISWGDNGGLISNNLKLEYSVNSGSSWTNVVASGLANNGSYNWHIPDAVSQACLVRLTDLARPTTVVITDTFEIGEPKITITAPNGGEVWAVGDKAPVTWTSEGAVSENLVIEYSPNGGSTYYLVKSGQGNSGSYTWTIPDLTSANALLRIRDGDRPQVVDVSDSPFFVNPMPTMEILTPNGGEIWVLGETQNITWDWTGLSISDNLLIEASNDDFASTRQIVATGAPNTGTYVWTINEDSLTGATLKIRVTDGNRTEITDKTDGYYKIRGGFTLLSPNGAENWGAKSSQTVSWQTQGNIPNVKLDYSINGGTSWSTIAASTPNMGSYAWTLPDVQQEGVLVRVSDPSDSEVMDESDAGFNIVYMTVQFKLLDYDTMEHLADFGVSEPNSGWSDTGLVSPITRTLAYPYGTYSTFFNKTNFIDTSVTWSPPKTGTNTYVITAYMESTASAQVTWEAILTYSFSPANDSLTAVGSLQRKGALVGTREMERLDMGAATFTIYKPDGATVKHTLVSATPSTTGMYNFTLSDTGFESGEVYPATLSIVYRDRPYTSSASIDVGSEILQYEFFTQTATNLATSVASIELSVAGGTAQTRADIEASGAETRTDIAASKAGLQTYVSEEIAATKSKIEEARQEHEVAAKSEILNRDNVVKSGGTITIRYRTYTGLTPVMSVYDGNNRLRISNEIMTEIGDTGIYEYPVTFKWGQGEYSIICYEETHGSLDALLMSVIGTDLEGVASSVGAIMGTTSGLSDFADTASALNSQFVIIENAINNMSKDIVSKVKEAVEGATGAAEIFDQLSGISDKIKKMYAENQKVNLGELLELEPGKQQDMDYLKNKTNELKAMMQLNQKMMDDVANEPTVQTWYEYKSVVLKAIIVNPSETQTKTVPFKAYLPKEAKPEHVLYKGELTITYDTQQGSYYAHSNFELKPKATKVIEIEMKDIWQIELKELIMMRKEAKQTYDLLKNTEFSERAEYLLKKIEEDLDTIEEKQKIKDTNPEIHISDYRDNLKLLEDIKKNLALTRTLLSQAEPFNVQSTWKVIIAIIIFLGILSLGFYVIWQKQASLSPEADKKTETTIVDKEKKA